MASVFVLHHVHVQEDGVEDVKFIGAYSSREVGRLRGAPEPSTGFLGFSGRLSRRRVPRRSGPLG
jgi:hypothetical protein